MTRYLIIIVLGLLLSGNAYAQLEIYKRKDNVEAVFKCVEKIENNKEIFFYSHKAINANPGMIFTSNNLEDLTEIKNYSSILYIDQKEKKFVFYRNMAMLFFKFEMKPTGKEFLLTRYQYPGNKELEKEWLKLKEVFKLNNARDVLKGLVKNSDNLSKIEQKLSKQKDTLTGSLKGKNFPGHTSTNFNCTLEQAYKLN